MNIKVNINKKEEKVLVRYGDLIETIYGDRGIVIKTNYDVFAENRDVFNVLMIHTDKDYNSADLYFRMPLSLEEIGKNTKKVLMRYNEYNIKLEEN